MSTIKRVRTYQGNGNVGENITLGSGKSKRCYVVVKGVKMVKCNKQDKPTKIKKKYSVEELIKKGFKMFDKNRKKETEVLPNKIISKNGKLKLILKAIVNSDNGFRFLGERAIKNDRRRNYNLNQMKSNSNIIFQYGYRDIYSPSVNEIKKFMKFLGIDDYQITINDDNVGALIHEGSIGEMGRSQRTAIKSKK